MIKTFTKENSQYEKYITANDGAVYYRYPEKIVVFTGDDIPPSDLDDKYCELMIDGLRDSLLADGHGADRVDAWLGKYL
jgi:hypothetical protein